MSHLSSILNSKASHLARYAFSSHRILQKKTIEKPTAGFYVNPNVDNCRSNPRLRKNDRGGKSESLKFQTGRRSLLDIFADRIFREKHMPNIHRSALLSMSAFAAIVISAVPLSAQQPQPTRVRGIIEKVEGNILSVKSREGNDVRIQTGEKTGVIGLKKISLADIQPNAFVGVAAQPQPDGTQKAISIHIFPESSRGFNEGSRPYDVRPNSSMTNGAVANRVKGAEGDILTVTYKDGEKKIVVTPETSIVRFEPGDFSELSQGAKIVATVLDKPDGTKEAVRINVGRDGITPAM